MNDTNYFSSLQALLYMSIVGMIIVAGFLITEYVFFKEQAARLLLLQDEYQTYIQAYREWWETQHPGSVGKQSDGVSFNVVNRDIAYLKECAASFGKEHNIPAVLGIIQDWYVNPGEWVARPEKKPQLKRAGRSFKQPVTGTFYNRDLSMRWPIERSLFWISSPFGPRKKKDGSWGFHYGIDMAALKGTLVHACAQGVVVETSYSPYGYGKSVVLLHEKKYRTRYAHLDTILVQEGQRVRMGDTIGRVGDSGAVRGKRDASHLHLEVLDPFGKRINPRYILK